MRTFGSFFGEPWPSGVCDDGVQVATPVGESCAFCQELIATEDRGSFVGLAGYQAGALAPVHRECSFRSVIGGIGHHEDHTYWCKQRGDPDGGRTRRQSALEVWARFAGTNWSPERS